VHAARRPLAPQIALPIYWVTLFALTHYPRVHIPGAFSYRDKVAHVTAFALLAALWWWFWQTRRALGSRFVAVSAAVLIGYAALDEYLQQFVGRDTDLADWIADVAGIAVALAVLELRRRRRRMHAG